MEIQRGCVSVEANDPLPTEGGAHGRTSANRMKGLKSGEVCTPVCFAVMRCSLLRQSLSPNSTPSQLTSLALMLVPNALSAMKTSCLGSGCYKISIKQNGFHCCLFAGRYKCSRMALIPAKFSLIAGLSVTCRL